MTNEEKIKDNFEIMVREVAKYIETHGGKVVVIGGISVEKRDSKHNYTLRINFTGKPPKPFNI